jgi:hypothetical protein
LGLLTVFGPPERVAGQVTGYSVYVDSAEAGAGADIPVRFYLSNEAEVSTVSVPISYDPTLVSLKSISFTDSRAEHLANKVVTPSDPTTANGHFFVALLQWQEDPIPVGDGLLFTALFSVKASAAIGEATELDTLFYAPGGTLEVVPTGSTVGVKPTFVPGQILVGENNRPPVFASLSEVYILEGDSLDLTVIATDPDNDELTLAVTTKPTGATFVDHGDGTARFVFVPDYVGPNSADGSPVRVSFWAGDGDLSAQLDVTVNILNRNRKPMITAPEQLAIEAGEELSMTISAIDPDFEPIDWVWNGLPGGAQFDADNPGQVSWISSVSDSGSFEMEFIAVDPQGLADTVKVLTSIRAVALYSLAIDSIEAFPGEVVEFNVVLDNKLPVAGFNLLINHDPSALTFLSLLNTGTRTESFEYFVATSGYNGVQGDIRIVGVANVGGGTSALAEGEGSIAVGKLRTTGDLNFAGMSIPVKFVFRDDPTNDDNTLTDASAQRIEQQDIVYVNGAVQMQDIGVIKIGDINLNNIPAEIGDVIYFTNFFINPSLYKFNALQYANSDVNRDNVAATVSDLVALINWVVTGATAGKTGEWEDGEASLRASSEGDAVVFEFDANIDIGGVFLVLKTESDMSLDRVENLSGGMTLDVARVGNEIKILIYSLKGETIGAGEGRLVSLPLTGEYSITRMEMGSADGRQMSLSMASEKPLLPSAFELDQNYPNPFNPETSIHFALPTMARVQLVVYNVLGQQVAVLADGEYPAGNHQVTWNGTDRNGESVASGVYLYRLSTDAENLTRKMMLLK